MSVHESNLIDAAQESSPAGDHETDFERILDAAVDPPLEMCKRMSDLRAPAPGQSERDVKWDKAVFLINCVGYLEVRLALFSADVFFVKLAGVGLTLVLARLNG